MVWPDGSSSWELFGGDPPLHGGDCRQADWAAGLFWGGAQGPVEFGLGLGAWCGGRSSLGRLDPCTRTLYFGCSGFVGQLFSRVFLLKEDGWFA